MLPFEESIRNIKKIINVVTCFTKARAGLFITRMSYVIQLTVVR